MFRRIVSRRKDAILYKRYSLSLFRSINISCLSPPNAHTAYTVSAGLRQDLKTVRWIQFPIVTYHVKQPTFRYQTIKKTGKGWLRNTLHRFWGESDSRAAHWGQGDILGYKKTHNPHLFGQVFLPGHLSHILHRFSVSSLLILPGTASIPNIPSA